MKNQSNQPTSELVKLVNHPAYLLLQAGCRYFNYELEQNECKFTFTAKEFDYREDFLFQPPATAFLDNVLFRHFNEVGKLRHKKRAEFFAQHEDSRHKHQTFKEIAILVNTYFAGLDNQAKWQNINEQQMRKILWQLYSHLESLTICSGYLENLLFPYLYYEADHIMLEIHLQHGGPYEFRMTPQGLSAFWDLVQALCFCQTVNSDDMYCAESTLHNLQDQASQRFCHLDISTDKSTASLLKVDENQLTFKTYDLSGCYAPSQFYQLIREIKQCPLTSSAKDSDKIFRTLYYANRANAEFLVRTFPKLVTLINAE